jgi:hypothetical protein
MVSFSLGRLWINKTLVKMYIQVFDWKYELPLLIT